MPPLDESGLIQPQLRALPQLDRLLHTSPNRAAVLQARLLNAMAVCHMRMGDWSDAESYLLEAYEKDAKNPDTLANLVTVELHLGKPVSRHRECAPGACLLAVTLGSGSEPGSGHLFGCKCMMPVTHQHVCSK